ncbi:MAG: alpha/beta hydrolase [Oceanicaulis sp.]
MGLPISLEDWRAGGSRFDWRGHEIFYRTGGDWSSDAPVLMLIHGFPTASWDWAHQWEALCTRYRVIAPDLIGFGFSAKPEGYPYSILDQADLCEALLEAHGVKEAHLLAHDYGDTVAQEMLARHIDRQAAGDPGLRLGSVCFLNGGLFPEQHRPTVTQHLVNSPLGPLVARMMTRDRFGKGLSEVFGPDTKPTDAELDAFWAMANTNGSLRRIGHRLIKYIAERRANRERWVGALMANTVPMRVIDGALDPVSGAHMVARYQELVPEPDCVLLADVGHYPQLEAPQRVLDAYMEFRSGIVTA